MVDTKMETRPGEIVTVEITYNNTVINGDLCIPENAAGIIVFAHGSGSSRFSERNRFVANKFHQAKFATLLIDLLTAAEEIIDQETAQLRFDIDLLAQRLITTIEWLSQQPMTRALKVGLFGSSTGAASALIATAKMPDYIYAVVSRGGRPDLASAILPSIKAPTLFIVGALDTVVLDLNEQAMLSITAEKRLAIIPAATHLFPEPGALEEVAEIACQWFLQHICQMEIA